MQLYYCGLDDGYMAKFRSQNTGSKFEVLKLNEAYVFEEKVNGSMKLIVNYL